MKPCPKCKSKNIRLVNAKKYNAKIICLDCGYLIGGFSTTENLVNSWNELKRYDCMNIEKFKDMVKITESQRIHNEIFQDSILYKYYCLGVAQGYETFYNMFNTYKDKYPTHTAEELMAIIKNGVNSSGEKLIKEYFERLVKEKL